jgi:CheY-like chemotaxis protein
VAQVLSNLLDNAAKYTPAGGTIEMTIERRGEYIIIVVRDNGAGIPPEMVGHIFEMFTRSADARQSETGGMGIGLALVKSIVELHGGQIEARSDGPARGAEFCVRLPIVTVAAPVDAVVSLRNGHADKQAKQRLLIVDDNVAAAGLLEMLLRKHGHEVHVAHDGLEAVEVAERYRPHVVLMDLGMPKLDGYEAAKRIRREPWGRDMLLVAVTGWGQDGDRQRTSDAGFDHHLVKPAQPALIQQILAQTKERK